MLKHKLNYKTQAGNDYVEFKTKNIMAILEQEKFHSYRRQLIDTNPELTVFSIEKIEESLVIKHLPGKTVEKTVVIIENIYRNNLGMDKITNDDVELEDKYVCNAKE